VDDPASLRYRAARLREMARFQHGDSRDTLRAAAAELERAAAAVEAQLGALTARPANGRDRHAG